MICSMRRKKAMKVGVIVGAGASAAINPKRVPLMNNFFEMMADFAKRDEQVEKTLKTLQKYKLISHDLIPKGNLEDVLTQTLSLPRNQMDPWERPYDGLLLTLHRIFHILNEELDIYRYVDCLSPLCELDPEDVVFISFNYDVFLEKALEKLFSWSADFGCSPNVLVGYINAEQAEQAQSPNQICDEVSAWSWNIPPKTSFPSKSTSPIQKGNGSLVLKPHGSLNWFIHSEGRGRFWMSNHTHGFLLMRPINGKVSIPRFWIYPTTNTVNGELADSNFLVGAVLPAIIPPGEKFSKVIPPFQRIEKLVEEALSQISALVIIGWSMRQSDKKYKSLFTKVVSKRKSALDVIAVCDFQRNTAFYSRFKNLLPAQSFECCNEGFMTQNAKKLLEKVIEPIVLNYVSKI